MNLKVAIETNQKMMIKLQKIYFTMTTETKKTYIFLNIPLGLNYRLCQKPRLIELMSSYRGGGGREYMYPT